MRTFLLNLSPESMDLSPYRQIFYDQDGGNGLLTVLSCPGEEPERCLEKIRELLLRENSIHPDYRLIIYSSFFPREDVPYHIKLRMCDVLCQEKLLAVRMLFEAGRTLFREHLMPERLLFLFGEACSHGQVAESRESIAGLTNLHHRLWYGYLFPALSAYTGQDPEENRSLPMIPEPVLHEISGLLPKDADLLHMNEDHLKQVYLAFLELYKKKLVNDGSSLNIYCPVQYAYTELSSDSAQYRRDVFRLLVHANTFARSNAQVHVNPDSYFDPITDEAAEIPEVDFENGLSSLLAKKISLMTGLTDAISTGRNRSHDPPPKIDMSDFPFASLEDYIANKIPELPLYKEYQNLSQQVTGNSSAVSVSPFIFSSKRKLRLLIQQLDELRKQNASMQKIVQAYSADIHVWYLNNKSTLLRLYPVTLDRRSEPDSITLAQQIESLRNEQNRREEAFAETVNNIQYSEMIEADLAACKRKAEAKCLLLSQYPSALPLYIGFPLLSAGVIWLFLRDGTQSPAGLWILSALGGSLLLCAVVSWIRKRRSLAIKPVLRQGKDLCDRFYASWEQICSGMDHYQQQLRQLIPQSAALENEIRRLEALKAEADLQKRQESWHQQKLDEYICLYKNILTYLGLPMRSVSAEPPPDLSPARDLKDNCSVYGLSDEDIARLAIQPEGGASS